MSNFSNAKYDNISGKGLYFRMVRIATRLTELMVHIADDFLVHIVLNYVPMKIEQLKISYSAKGKNGV